MKRGENPQRGMVASTAKVARIFVICYIPEFSGFFKDMRTILKLSLDSLARSLRPEISRVSLIANGCCKEAQEILAERHSELFDQLIINRQNLGKVNGLLSAARGALEEVVVLSDCDVLFRPGWLDEVLKVFDQFPEAGSVSPATSPKRYGYENRTTLIAAMIKRELMIDNLFPLGDLRLLSEGMQDTQGQFQFASAQAVVRRGSYATLLGGGHQCLAFRSELLKRFPDSACTGLLDPASDREFLDNPPDRLGYWRLGTPRTVAFHMGNTPQSWMFEEMQPSSAVFRGTLRPLRKPAAGMLPYGLRDFLGNLIARSLRRRLRRMNGDAHMLAENSAPTFRGTEGLN